MQKNIVFFTLALVLLLFASCGANTPKPLTGKTLQRIKINFPKIPALERSENIKMVSNIV